MASLPTRLELIFLHSSVHNHRCCPQVTRLSYRAQSRLDHRRAILNLTRTVTSCSHATRLDHHLTMLGATGTATTSCSTLLRPSRHALVPSPYPRCRPACSSLARPRVSPRPPMTPDDIPPIHYAPINVARQQQCRRYRLRPHTAQVPLCHSCMPSTHDKECD
jgi:hypothetical protein